MLRNHRAHTTIAAALLAGAMFSASRANAQGQSSTSLQLTGAQCRVLLQALQANAQTGGTKPLTPAQAQLLGQCLASQGPGGANQSLSAAQSEMLLQGFGAQAQTGPIAAPALSQGPRRGLETPQSSLGVKKPGVVRIGVVQPKAQMGQGNSGGNVAEPIRELISQYLNGPSQEIVPISAMLVSQIDAEAKMEQCDYVLYSAISQKMSGGGAMSLLKHAGPMTSMIPMVGMAGGMTGAVAGAAAGSAVASAASVASTVKAKSEVTFDYKLVVPGNAAAVLANTEKAKAKEDGEDVISPLIEQAATAVVAELSKRK